MVGTYSQPGFGNAYTCMYTHGSNSANSTAVMFFIYIYFVLPHVCAKTFRVRITIAEGTVFCVTMPTVSLLTLSQETGFFFRSSEFKRRIAFLSPLLVSGHGY